MCVLVSYCPHKCLSVSLFRNTYFCAICYLATSTLCKIVAVIVNIIFTVHFDKVKTSWLSFACPQTF